jgi:hydrogenase expression/formation protein HypC
MCLGVPGQVVEVLDDRPDLAKVDVGGARRAINIGLLEHETVQPGDWVLIHLGYALSKIDEDEAKAALELLEGVGQADADELEAPQAWRIAEGRGASIPDRPSKRFGPASNINQSQRREAPQRRR